MRETRKQRLLAIMAQATATIGSITANANKDMVMYEQWRVDYSSWIGEQRDIFDDAPKELDSIIANSEAAEEITELRARVAELDGQVFAMKRGNTILIDSLMGMVDQFFRDDGSGNLSHRFMAAEEYAIKTLLEAGFAEEIDGDYRLLWDKIEEREKSLNDEVTE